MKLIKLELRKALRNKAFYISIAISMIFVILSLIYCVNVYRNDMDALNWLKNNSEVVRAPGTPIYTLFSRWIGGEGGSVGSSVFFFVFPIICTLPYGWSYCVEKNNGYLRMVVVQSGKKAYYASKYIATFISGGLAVVIPMVISFIMSAAYFPAIKPNVIYDVYYGVFKSYARSELFYTNPFLYDFIYICIVFVFCGLLACFSMAVTSFIRKKYIVTLVPFMICLAVHFSTNYIYDFSNQYNKEISPFYIIRAYGMRYPVTDEVQGIMIAVFVAITIGIIFFWERKREVY